LSLVMAGVLFLCARRSISLPQGNAPTSTVFWLPWARISTNVSQPAMFFLIPPKRPYFVSRLLPDHHWLVSQNLRPFFDDIFAFVCFSFFPFLLTVPFGIRQLVDLSLVWVSGRALLNAGWCERKWSCAAVLPVLLRSSTFFTALSRCFLSLFSVLLPRDLPPRAFTYLISGSELFSMLA